jgi:serine/threonine-protein kinase
MSDVFVSYKAEDRKRVRPLVEALQADGYSVWWDEQIGGGAAWRHAIEAELNAAKCVIVVWSKRSVGPEGEFVQDEASRAKERHVYVPVRIENVHLPLGFGETQALPLAGWHGDRADPHYRAVLSAVRSMAGECTVSERAAVQPHINRRTALAGGAVAVAAIAGIGGWFLLRPGAAKSESIAVLPFANLSGDPAQGYFSDGVAEEIRSALARIPQLKVVARTSSELVRNDDPGTAARKLHVSNILAGSVRRSASIIRVSAQLIDPSSGVERWSEVYDRPTGDALVVQTDIARRVAQALSLRLSLPRNGLLTVGGTDNPHAQEIYLKAVGIRQSGLSEAGFTQAVKLLDEAIRLDPNYAEAYAERGATVAELSGYFGHGPTAFEKGYAQAVPDAQRAIAIAPDLPSGYAALALTQELHLDLKRALANYRRAAASPNAKADTLTEAANFLAQLGYMEEALGFVRRAVEIDPLNARAYEARTIAFFNRRRYADVVQAAQSVLQLAPNDGPSLALLANALLLRGKFAEAKAVYAKGPADDVRILTGEAILAARLGDRAGSDRFLKRLHETAGEAASFQYAEVHAQRGELDQAFAALDEAVAIRDPGLIFLPSDPFLDPLRKNPRFQAIIAKFDFPPRPQS